MWSEKEIKKEGEITIIIIRGTVGEGNVRRKKVNEK